MTSTYPVSRTMRADTVNLVVRALRTSGGGNNRLGSAWHEERFASTSTLRIPIHPSRTDNASAQSSTGIAPQDRSLGSASRWAGRMPGVIMPDTRQRRGQASEWNRSNGWRATSVRPLSSSTIISMRAVPGATESYSRPNSLEQADPRTPPSPPEKPSSTSEDGPEDPEPETKPEPEPTTVSGRLKALFTKYGKHAIGVYLALSAVDLGIAYLGVHLVGADKIEHLKDLLVDAWRYYVPSLADAGDGDAAADDPSAGMGRESINTTINQAVDAIGTTSAQVIDTAASGKKKSSSMSGSTLFWAEFALAYGIHKTLFLPVRVGLTAAWTPKLVAWLTRRGWVGKGGVGRAAAHGKEKGLEKVKSAQVKVKVAQEKAQDRLKELTRKG